MKSDRRVFLDPTTNDKVLWVKFGWSDYYRGGQVDGNFGWLKAAKGGKDEGRGHEAFNFMASDDGTYYCYVPPQSATHAPSNDDNTGWTVICLAKNPKHKGIHIVGWYENATLIGDWIYQPPDHPASGLGDEASPYDWSYCISSQSVFFIPPESRTYPFSHSSIRQGKYSFLKGPGVQNSLNKQEVLEILHNKIQDLSEIAIRNPTAANSPDPELDSTDPLAGFGTAEHRKKVEKAAEEAVKKYYSDRKYTYKDCTKIKCGYDFKFIKGSDVLNVEVKGTSSKTMGFFLTRNEYETGMSSGEQWRLAMVTDALARDPVVKIFDFKQVSKIFDLIPYVYIGKQIYEAK